MQRSFISPFIGTSYITSSMMCSRIARRPRAPVPLWKAIRASSFKADGQEWQALVGKEGVAQSALRPSGVALIEGRRLDVITAGLWIESGTPVRVQSVQGHRVEVIPLAPAAPAEPRP